MSHDSSRTPAIPSTPTTELTRVVHVNDHVDGAVYVGRCVPRKRLKGHPLANPFKIGRDGTRADVIHKYAAWLDDLLVRSTRQATFDALYPLAGKPLACWCRRDGEAQTPENACHADVLIAVMKREGVSHD